MLPGAWQPNNNSVVALCRSEIKVGFADVVSSVNRRFAFAMIKAGTWLQSAGWRQRCSDPAFPAVHPLPQPPMDACDPAASGRLPREVAPGSGGDQELVRQLVHDSHAFDGTAADPERNCWLAVHRHVHGVLPSEYDIREVPEELYLAVLAARRAAQSDPAG